MCTWLLVGLDTDWVALALGHVDRGDLVLEAPCFHGRDRFTLGLHRKRILLFTGDAVTLSQVFCRDTPLVVVESVGQAVTQEGVVHHGVAQPQAGTCLVHDKGSQTHAFLTTGQHQIGIAQCDSLRRQMHGFQTRAAQLVQGQQIKQLESDLNRYQSEAYIREQARLRLGVIEPGETAFRIVDPALDTDTSVTSAGNEEEPLGAWYENLWDSVTKPEALGEEEIAPPAVEGEVPTLAPTEEAPVQVRFRHRLMTE